MLKSVNKFFDDLMKDIDSFCNGNSLCVFLIIMTLGFLVCKYFNLSGFSVDNLMELDSADSADSLKESGEPSPASAQQMEEYVPIGLKPSSTRPEKLPPSLMNQMKGMGPPQPMMGGQQQKQQLLVQDGSIVKPFNEIWNPGFMPVDMVFQGAIAPDKLGYGPMGKDRPMAPTLKRADAPKLQGGSGSEASLVLVYAPWCGHSKKMLPDYEKVKSEYHGKQINGTTMNIVMYNSDVDKDKVKEYQVKGFPTLFYEKNGEKQPFASRDYDGIVAELERLNA